MARRPSALEELQALQASSLGFALIRCGQLFNDEGMARVNADAGGPVLREAHTRLLPHLQAPGGVRITTLAAKLGVTKQAVQQLVADLVEVGVVRVASDPDDARARRILLTELGLNAMLHGTGILHAIEAELARELGKREVKALHRLLTRLLPVLERRAAP